MSFGRRARWRVARVASSKEMIGGGDDRFVFETNAFTGSAADRITDFD